MVILTTEAEKGKVAAYGCFVPLYGVFIGDNWRLKTAPPCGLGRFPGSPIELAMPGLSQILLDADPGISKVRSATSRYVVLYDAIPRSKRESRIPAEPLLEPL